MPIDFWDAANVQFDFPVVIKSHSMRYSLVNIGKIIEKSDLFVFKVGPRVLVVARLTNALKISSNGSNRKDFPQLVGPTIKMLLFFCLPFIIAFLLAQAKKYWLILLFLKIVFAHLSQCFSLHVSTQSEFIILLITCILVLRDRSNLRLAPYILHVVSIRSARALGVLFKTKLCKSGSPSCARAHTQEFIFSFYSLPNHEIANINICKPHRFGTNVLF